MNSQLSTKRVAVLVSLLMVFGAINTLVLKLMNLQKIDNKNFYHPYIQGCLMFIGESLCLVVYYFRNWQRGKVSSDVYAQSKPTVPVSRIAIPGFMDFLGSNLAYIGLNMIPGSVWQLSKGGSIVTTAIFTKLLLRASFTKFKVAGCLMAVVGITLVGLGLILFPKQEKVQSLQQTSSGLQQALGIGFVIVSLLFTGLQFTYQEHLFKKYETDVFQVVGFEGFFGLIFNIILIAILNQINCPVSWGTKCGGQTIQSVGTYFSDIRQQPAVLALSITLIFSIAISVSIGVTITKKISSLSRAIVDVTRTAIIWTVGIILTETKIYDNMENTRIQAILFEIAGFLIIIVGTVLYHKNKKTDLDDELSLLRSKVGTDDGVSMQNQQRVSRQSLI